MRAPAAAGGLMALALAACSAPPPPGGPIALCASQSGLSLRAAKAVAAGQPSPVAATDAEAAAINACLVRAGAPAIDRAVTVAVPTPEREGAGLFTEGSGYRGSSLVEVAIMGTGAKPVPYAKPVAAKPAPAGKLPLPTGYPLLPGDAELWATLTRAQQERALLYLQDGSTIRASLRTD